MHPNPPHQPGQGQGPQYGQPYGQPEPQYGQPYGQPADHTSPSMYGPAGQPYGGDPAAAQPSAVPYNSQASAPPYSPAAPDANTMYNQPPPNYGHPLGPPVPAAKGKKSSFVPVLAVLCGALVLVIGGVVALLVVKESGQQDRKTAQAEQSAAAAKSKAPVVDCMVGKFRQVEYRKDVDLDDAGVGTVRMKGPKDGTGIKLTITKDGKMTENWDDLVYEGVSKAKQQVRVRFEGGFSYVVRTEGGKLIKDQPDGSATVFVDVDGKPKIKFELDPTGDQTTYACEGKNSFSFAGEDDDYYSKYERVKE